MEFAAAVTTSVVNLTVDDYDTYIGRGPGGEVVPTVGVDGWLGNPFPAEGSTPKLRQRCIDKFRAYFLNRVECDPEFRAAVLAVRGTRLGCFCHPRSCHGDIIANWVDNQSE